MNREQSKIVGKMSDEQLMAIGKECWIENRVFIIAYGDDKEVLLRGNSYNAGFGFTADYADYSIKEETQIINNIECPMYVDNKRQIITGEYFYYESIESHVYYSVAYFVPDHIINRRIVHLTKENAIKCCKARYGIKI